MCITPVMYTDGTGQFPVLAILAIAAIMLFTPVGGTGTVAQVATSVVCYAGMAVASIWDKDIRADMNAIHWNPFNSNENTVLGSNKVSFYKGMPVFLKDGGRSGSFYAIFLDKNSSVDVLRHERGHGWQAMIMGIGSYALAIGLPSWQMWGSSKWSDYYNSPWEVTADLLGGSNNASRTRAERTRGWWYLAVSSVFFPAAYFFLI